MTGQSDGQDTGQFDGQECAVCGPDTGWRVLGGHIACARWEDRAAEPADVWAEPSCPCGAELTTGDASDHSICPVLADLFTGETVVDPFTLGDDFVQGIQPDRVDNGADEWEHRVDTRDGYWPYRPSEPVTSTLTGPTGTSPASGNADAGASGNPDGGIVPTLPVSRSVAAARYGGPFTEVTLSKLREAVDGAGGRLALTPTKWAALLGKGTSARAVARVMRDIGPHAGLVIRRRKSNGDRLLEAVDAR